MRILVCKVYKEFFSANFASPLRSLRLIVFYRKGRKGFAKSAKG